MMKSLCTIATTLMLSVTTISAQSLSPSTKWHWEEGTIKVDVPARPAGQENVIQLKTPKLEKVRVGFVGLGMRGPDAVERYTQILGTQIVALCDYEESRAEGCQEILRKAGFPPAAIYSGENGYEELCKRDDIDLVYVATDWDHHFPVAECALNNGKHVAIEVPSAMNLEQIWTLINLSEKNRLHCMILENCCYDWYEMTALNMAQKGVFGEVIRAEGAYIHTLDPYWDEYWKNPNDESMLGWRMKYNKENRGDVYPTHGLGPVAQVMNIHRGDRFTTLVAMDTKSVHGQEFVTERNGECKEFRNGDHTTTLLRTAEGKVVEIQHNVMTPQPYNRLYKITGSKGYATKYPTEEYSLSAEQLAAVGVTAKNKISYHSFLPKEEHEALEEIYRHPILKKFGEMALEVGGHGGMDYIMDSRLVYCLQNGLPLDMDVYDLAEWCCLAELGAISMDHNCAAVEFPDFTRGHWNDIKTGFNHAYVSEQEEQATEALAKAFTDAQKAVTAKLKLWEAYDKTKAKPATKKAFDKLMKKAVAEFSK